MTREEIIAFAKEYDPQPMHLDDAAAEKSLLKGLAGSGWHLCSLMMRMIFDGYLHETASLGSPGVSENNWVAPFRPGDDLMLDVTVAEARASQSRPELGLVTFNIKIANAHQQTLLTSTFTLMIKRKGAA